MSWCVIITDGDSVLQEYDDKSPIQYLLEAGIIPIVRWQAAVDRVFTGEAVAKKLAPVYKPFGAPCLFQIYNEPFDVRESEDGITWAAFVRRWNDAAKQVIKAGCYPLFPDGPDYNYSVCNPFRDTTPGYWLDGYAGFGVHNYGKGRPVGYPYDDVTRHGDNPKNWLTEEEYNSALGIYRNDPRWKDLPPDAINKQRTQWANPNLTALEDGVCWRGWEKVAYYSTESLGFVVPMFMTEGGWQPRDRAGKHPNIDIRWPLTTPEMVGERTLEMFNTPSPLIAQCPWLLGCRWMGGIGWEDDAWAGGSFTEEYGFEKPVIQVLRDNPPQYEETPESCLIRAGQLLQEVSDALRLQV